MRPPERDGVRGQMIRARRRRAGAVGDAAEVAGRKGVADGEAVTSEYAVFGAGLPIGAYVVAIRIVTQAGVAHEVVDLMRGIGWMREQVNQFAGKRIHAGGGNGVISEWLAVCRIV